MILHVASIVAFFVDQLTFEPVQIQCVSNAGQDPILVRLLFDAVPSIFALGIAALVFYWNSGREHEQWVRDQKHVEWRELLDKVSAVSKPMTLARPKGTILKDQVKEGLVDLAQCLDDRVFIERQILYEIYEQLTKCLEKMGAYTVDKESCDESLQETRDKVILEEIREITERVRRAARKDLGIEELGEPDAMP